jgi:hypothetical protein
VTALPRYGYTGCTERFYYNFLCLQSVSQARLEASRTKKSGLTTPPSLPGSHGPTCSEAPKDYQPHQLHHRYPTRQSIHCCDTISPPQPGWSLTSAHEEEPHRDEHPRSNAPSLLRARGSVGPFPCLGSCSEVGVLALDIGSGRLWVSAVGRVGPGRGLCRLERKAMKARAGGLGVTLEGAECGWSKRREMVERSGGGLIRMMKGPEL